MVPDFLSLPGTKRALVDGSISNTRIFCYFFVIVAIDNLQLAILQLVPAQPTAWTPYSVCVSICLGVVYLIGTYWLNGGNRGKDYLQRYFALSAVVALWIAVPFQVALSLPGYVAVLSDLDWYVPTLILATNIMFFGFVALQIHQVAQDSASAG